MMELKSEIVIKNLMKIYKGGSLYTMSS